MIDLFGRVPVKARQWVRYLIYLPDRKLLSISFGVLHGELTPVANMTWAYNSGGNIAMFGRVDGDLTVFIHETGHSLDFLGAYPDKPLSNSTKWLAQYSKDSHVPDSYAQTNQLEDVAQNTVVANYDLNVPGGFRAIEGNWSGISHQFHTIEVEQKKASGLLEPGGVCGKRLENSQTVPVVGSSRVMARGLGGPPDSKLSDSVDVIEPAEFDTREDCKGGF